MLLNNSNTPHPPGYAGCVGEEVPGTWQSCDLSRQFRLDAFCGSVSRWDKRHLAFLRAEGAGAGGRSESGRSGVGGRLLVRQSGSFKKQAQSLWIDCGIHPLGDTVLVQSLNPRAAGSWLGGHREVTLPSHPYPQFP